MILLIDNYDSFTFNLVHLLGGEGAECDVRRNDALSVAEAIGLGPDAVVLSPGPGAPRDAGICIELARACAARAIPLLGVCLGHQSIGEAFGGTVVRAVRPMHGKVDAVLHGQEPDGLFAGLDDRFEATRYHSLAVDRATLPSCLRETARTADGTIMGLAHRSAPVFGVQFHPESIASPCGRTIVANFLLIAAGNRRDAGRAAGIPSEAAERRSAA